MTDRTYKRTPTELRRLARRHLVADPECYRFRLAYRPPYDWNAALAFLGARATPGVESVVGSHYRRNIQIEGKTGVIDVSHVESGSALVLDVRFSDARSLLFIVERVRRVFDLGADPVVIEQHLSPDPLLRQLLSRHPGIRTPGAWDGFELAVRAIVGQQISVRAATTIAGRIASMFGSPVADGRGLDRLFPSPVQLANAAIERAGVTTARAGTIRSLARTVADGTISFNASLASLDGRATVSALRAVPGIGAWTAEYVAMRAFGEPDAFPSGDLVLRRAAGGCTAPELERKSEAWRPWRAYAVMLLWQGATDHGEESARMKHPELVERMNGSLRTGRSRHN